MPAARKKNVRETHRFTLVLEGARVLSAEMHDALFEAGCDDALLGSRDGALFLDFDREAGSLPEAISSAIHNVENSGIGLRVIRVEPDELVTLSDIASRIGRSRESIRLYANGERGSGGFPPPISHIKGRSPLWRWTDVVPWLARHVVKEHLQVAQEAGVIAAMNALLEFRRRLPDLRRIGPFQSILHEVLKGPRPEKPQEEHAVRHPTSRRPEERSSKAMRKVAGRA